MAETPSGRGDDEKGGGRPGAATGPASAAPARSGGSTDAPVAGVGASATSPSGASLGAKARAVAIASLIGVPAFAFLAVITWGAILAPLVGLLLLAPFVAVNYLLWGRPLTPGKPAGRRRRADDELA